MPRKRMIKPEFWTDEKIIELPIPGRLLFIGLLNFADDEGIFRNAPKSIKCEIFPADSNPSSEDVKDFLELMLKLKLIVKGKDLEDNELLKIKNWHDHQKINHPTPSKYIFKPISGGDSFSPKLELSEDSVSPNGELSEDSLTVKSSLISLDQSSLISLDKNSIEDKENSSKKTKTQQLREEFTFDRFYNLFPRKIKKENASRSFSRVPVKHLSDLFDGLDAYVKYWEDNDVGEEYIPHPSTWLNAKQWNDTVPEIKKEIKFKDEQDREIYNRNENIVKQSKRMRKYLKDAGDNADEIPNLLEDFKKGKSNAKQIGEIIGQMDTIPEANTNTDGQ